MSPCATKFFKVCRCQTGKKNLCICAFAHLRICVFEFWYALNGELLSSIAQMNKTSTIPYHLDLFLKIFCLYVEYNSFR